MDRRWRRALRAAALLCVAALVAGPAAGSVCAMSPSSGDGESHGCCRDGLMAEPPACCHAGASEAAAALVKSVRAWSAMSTEILEGSPALPACAPAASLSRPRTVPTHDPPLLVLRV